MTVAFAPIAGPWGGPETASPALGNYRHAPANGDPTNGFNREIHSLAFSPNNDILAAGSGRLGWSHLALDLASGHSLVHVSSCKGIQPGRT